MASKNIDQKKKSNPLLWFLFAIVLPFITVAIIAVIAFTIAGVDVAGWAKQTGSNIPGVSKMIDMDQEQREQHGNEELQEEVANKEDEVKALNRQIADLKSTIDEMEQKMEKLKNKNKTLSEKEKSPSRTDYIQAISSSFTDMDNERAAQILQNMEQPLAITILENLSSDVRGEILEAMAPDTAADITQQFMNRP
ncbi:hypothetical protein FH966_12260 [Lentibacillus cibarius]|uniref:Magnesium transporter MgtE intracellular domain-containing protein n=1 Tax=Lentibacillus cibarius TaxID=2583219 RepID=A0A549YKI9_9BACI|nr:hypothetical protein [Lentibacillus cibarius]TRM12402.1 hypothetical protein FH966_12260 [Lentibacillus cibarius]